MLSRRLFSTAASAFTTRSVGAHGTVDSRVFILKGTQTISGWHHIPLFHDSKQNSFLVNYVNEIPRGTRAKLELATKEENNPIKQDVKNGQLRFFKLGDIPFNYGCLPQTWEDPAYAHPDTKIGGDNDPIDVVEIGGALPVGTVTPVKVLGILGMIDQGETDWKVLTIANNHPLAAKMNDAQDIDVHMPGTTSAIREWFRNYKVPDGKPQNSFALDERVMNRDYALKVIQETHVAWQKLCAGQVASNKLWIPQSKPAL